MVRSTRAFPTIPLCILALMVASSLYAQDPQQQAEQVAETESPASGPPALIPVSDEHDMKGLASWYGGKFQGRLTANGEIFDTNQLTAAHRTLPFGTIVKVINRDNGQVVVVRINDRGPFVENRVIDLSRAAADLIGLTRTGVAPVSLQVMHLPEPQNRRVVQIGSFSVAENAEHLAAELRRFDLNAEIETTANGAIHRVVIRNVLVDDLDFVQRQLADIGYSNVLVRLD